MQNSVLEWNYHFSNLIMELMPQFIIMLPVLSTVKTPSAATTPSKPRAIGEECEFHICGCSPISQVQKLIDIVLIILFNRLRVCSTTLIQYNILSDIDCNIVRLNVFLLSNEPGTCYEVLLVL